MDALALLRLLSALAIFIPPPWGPIIAGVGKFLPLIAAGKTALDAVNAADPSIVPHLEQVAKDCFGNLDISVVAKAILAPHQMTQEERFQAEQAWMNRQGSGG